MTVYADPFNVHLAAVELLSREGVPAPQEWVALRNRWVDFTLIDRPNTDALVRAVVSGSNENIGLLRAAAIVESPSPGVNDADANNAVRAGVYERMVQLYSAVAHQNYATIGRRFNQIADAFTKCANTVDVEADSDDVVAMSDREREAWLSGAMHAQKLTELLPVLSAAATLAGMRRAHTDTEVEIPLVADVRGLHKRRVYESWNTSTGRCWRWSALHRQGSKLRAHPNPEGLQPYSPPRPFVILRWEKGHPITADPEDNPKAEVPAAVTGEGWVAD